MSTGPLTCYAATTERYGGGAEGARTWSNSQADPHLQAVTHLAAEDAAFQIEVRKDGGTSLDDIAA